MLSTLCATVQAQFFTRVTDVGPIVTDAFLSTGAAWNDFNNDGWPDLFALGETSNHLYVNNQDGTFSALTPGTFLTPAGVGNTSLWVDYNNDGYQDLFIANFVTEPGGTEVAPNVLYMNAGPPDFDLTEEDLPDGLNASPSASWVDYDQDGDVDLFSAGAAVSSGGPSTSDLFYRQDAGGVFRRMLNLPIIKSRQGFGTHDTWIDYDGDGDDDLFVVNWTQPNELYKSLLVETGNPDRFEQVEASGLTTVGTRFDIGSAWGDYDNDGDFDVFIPIINSLDRLYRNNGDGSFSRITGTPIGTQQSVMGVWGDYDNDGDLDLYAGSNSPAVYVNNGDGSFTVGGCRTG
ncbi:MAG: VCBS repeat-containing protein [Rhodothermales bacterium]|nr:VCBS repeat-containing protein [Rhodothermales bacterium]